MSDTVYINTKGLTKFLKSIKGTLPVIRVGILGAKDSRSGKVNSNAEIGARHEFGSAGMPVRSFLRVPIADNLDKYLTKFNAFDEDNLKKVINDGKLTVWLKQIGIVAENIVADAFSSGGFGKWIPSKHENGSGLTLVDTQQLRNSISSEVIGG